MTTAKRSSKKAEPVVVPVVLQIDRRDYFAGKALPIAFAILQSTGADQGVKAFTLLAELSYKLADAMLKAKAKTS